MTSYVHASTAENIVGVYLNEGAAMMRMVRWISWMWLTTHQARNCWPFRMALVSLALAFTTPEKREMAKPTPNGK